MGALRKLKKVFILICVVAYAKISFDIMQLKSKVIETIEASKNFPILKMSTILPKKVTLGSTPLNLPSSTEFKVGVGIIKPMDLSKFNGSGARVLRNCHWSRIQSVHVKEHYICIHLASQNDMVISRHVRLHRNWEKNMIIDIMQCLLRSALRTTFIDIGSNIGTHSLAAASNGHNVIAVEPYPENYKRLVQGVMVNKFDTKIKVFPYAVSDKIGKLNLTYLTSSKNLGGVAVADPNNKISGSKTEVPAITLNDLVPFIGTDTAVMKIDIESHECIAMRESRKLLSKISIKYIFMEWLQQHNINGSCVEYMMKILADFKYKPFVKLFDTRTLDLAMWHRWPKDIIWKK